MSDPTAASLRRTPRDSDLGLRTIASAAGLATSVLPNGCLFAIEDRRERGAVMISQVLGSPLGGGIARLYLRLGPEPRLVQAMGPAADVALGTAADRIVWAGEAGGVRHETTLWLHPDKPLWLWHVALALGGNAPLACDAILVQDIGLAARGFLMNGEAYASQYVDHAIVASPRLGPVILSRQNLAQDGTHPWAAHGCLDGAAGYATDARQLFGPAARGGDEPDLGWRDLASERLQHECACAILQSRRITLAPGGAATLTFFGAYRRDHPLASGDHDLAEIDAAARLAGAFAPRPVALAPVPRSLVQRARPAPTLPLDDAAVARLWPERFAEERRDGALLSFFTPAPPFNRHVVLREKERIVTRRHGALLRAGPGMLPDEATASVTCWMHGVFAAQLTIGNTSFHKLFSVSRDPYNITRTGGLRILVDRGDGFELLAVPSAFDIGLSDCRWIYRLADRTVAVHAVASGAEAALQWQVTVAGPPCRFLAVGHLVLGERELDQSGRVEIDDARKRFTFRPDPGWLWGERRPDAVYHVVTGTPAAIEAIGGEELLYPAGGRRGGSAAVMRTGATTGFSFAVVGSMTDAAAADRLADRHAGGVDTAAMAASAAGWWRGVTDGLRIAGPGSGVAALDTTLPWLVHDAMVHLTVPHGLEQYTGAAWGTRDVCQGPVELLLALEHDGLVREILKRVFVEQSEATGDWPQWFMLPPYSGIRDSQSHGDVIVWPLKAACDYIEATGDLALLDELVPWRRPDATASGRRDPIAAHIERLIATCRDRFIPGTRLVRYGEGDWNDALQPVDVRLKDWMVSSWTVALLFQQLVRYAEVLRRAGRAAEAGALTELAAAMRADFHRHLVRDGVVAGYAVFAPDGGEPELLLHPSDALTGLRCSLLPMTQAILAGLFTPAEAARHLEIIRAHLAYADGVRLMDRPVAYRGGVETVFRRAESSAFFGREIGLMYVHSHLRHCEAMAMLGRGDDLLAGLLAVNPVAVTEQVATASLRQRNAYFSSSDAAFRDRYEASARWDDLAAGRIACDGGWRIYSSGPGLTVSLILRYVLGRRRHFGERSVAPVLPAGMAVTATAQASTS